MLTTSVLVPSVISSISYFLSGLLNYNGLSSHPTSVCLLLSCMLTFCIYHQTRGPVLVKNKDSKTQQYHLPGDCPMASITCPTLADQHMTWCRFLKWLDRQNIQWHNAEKISKSKVLGPLGFSMWAPAFNSHPRLTYVDQAYYTINDLLISSSGKTRSLWVPFNHPPCRIF